MTDAAAPLTPPPSWGLVYVLVALIAVLALLVRATS